VSLGPTILNPAVFNFYQNSAWKGGGFKGAENPSSLFADRRKSSSPTSVITNNEPFQKVTRVPNGNFEFVRNVLDSEWERLRSVEGACGQIYACSKTVAKVQKITSATLAEVKFLRSLYHLNLMNFYQINVFPENIIITMPKMDGDLFGLATSKEFDIEQVHYTFFQVASAVQCMHDNEFVHRDIKPENVFFRNEIVNGENSYFVRLGDFGTVARLDDKRELLVSCGTREYMSPNGLLRRQYKSKPDQDLEPTVRKKDVNPFSMQDDVLSMMYLLSFIVFKRVPNTNEEHDLQEDDRISNGGMGFNVSKPDSELINQYWNFLNLGLTPTEAGYKYPNVETVMKDFNEL
jgi:serine/threonine protein kinase